MRIRSIKCPSIQSVFIQKPDTQNPDAQGVWISKALIKLAQTILNMIKMFCVYKMVQTTEYHMNTGLARYSDPAVSLNVI